MKTTVVLLSLLGVSLAQNNGGGFFSGITGAINNLFGGQPQPSRQQRPPQRRPQEFQPQQRPQQFQSQPAPQFQPQPSQTFQPQPPPQFQSQPQQTFQPASAPAPQFNPRPSSVVVQTTQRTRLIGGTSLCGAASPNHFWTDPRDGVRRGYVVTWKIGCSTFQQHEAKAYCESMGMEPVSLDSPQKQDNFNRLIAQDAQRYFWTGGEVDHVGRVVNWNNARGTPVKFTESSHWSHTGGAGIPQPDNRAAGENPPHPEVCLGILNNFYADGIKWHDVACHHKKPTICEPSN